MLGFGFVLIYKNGQIFCITDIFTTDLSRAFNRWVPRQRQLQIDCSRNGK